MGGLSILDLQSPNIASQKREHKLQNRSERNGHHEPVPLDIEFKAPNRALNGHVNALLAHHHTQPADNESDDEISSPLAMTHPNGIMSNGMAPNGMMSNGMAPNTFHMDPIDDHEETDLVPSHIMTNSGRRHSVHEAESDAEMPLHHDQPSR